MRVEGLGGCPPARPGPAAPNCWGRQGWEAGQAWSELLPPPRQAESQVCPCTALEFMLTRRPVYANEVGFQEASGCAAGHKDQTHPQLPGREA